MDEDGSQIHRQLVPAARSQAAVAHDLNGSSWLGSMIRRFEHFFKGSKFHGFTGFTLPFSSIRPIVGLASSQYMIHKTALRTGDHRPGRRLSCRTASEKRIRGARHQAALIAVQYRPCRSPIPPHRGGDAAGGCLQSQTGTGLAVAKVLSRQ